MRIAALVLTVALVTSACASIRPRDRGDVVRAVMASTVQLRTEREGGARRAGSGVVLFTEASTSWILTTRHLLEPSVSQTVSVVSATRPRRRVRAAVTALSAESDLALLRVEGLALPGVRLKDTVRLGDPVWVVAFPWGRRSTIVSGVVSQLTSDAGDASDAPVEGAASMVDASVSYGASGGGVFDAETGALVALVESHRTARVALPDARDRTLEVPVPGETTVIPVPVILRFIATTPLAASLTR
ncbi:MAG: trypsin-like peptidase domain-containing protein [Candidatus Rokubacteria bacterium]|nr:trypsin-like peptidase domain-containing protein [Candidatus Rokubacteria bacterium]